MSGYTTGGNDRIQATGIGHAFVIAIGDGGTMKDHAKAGNDTIQLSDFITIEAFGDAGAMSGHTVGGRDRITVSSGLSATVAGDAGTMSGNARGGNDVLTVSGEGDQFVYGDAGTMSGHAKGGNDRLIGGPGDQDLWGDAGTMSGHARGGKDTFVFMADSGNDRVHDFEKGKDRMEVSGYTAHSFGDLSIDSITVDDAAASLVHFDANNSVTVLGAELLRASDFHFA
jgi:Ca2+-binding RTX toxin-like protein